MFKCIIFVATYIGLTFAESIGDNLAKVLKISKSQKTIIIDRGNQTSFKRDELAYLLGNSKLKDKRIFYPVAKIKLIKEDIGFSVWVIDQKFKERIEEKENYVFFTQTNFLSGRSEIKISKRKITTNQRDQKENIKDSISKEDHKLSLKKENYHITTVALQSDILENKIGIVSVDRLEADNNKLKSIPIIEGPRISEFRNTKDMITFDKMIHLSINNANTTKTSVSNTDGIYLNSNTKFLDAQLDRIERTSKIAESYKNEGASWSDDLSDEELAQVLFKVGELKEIDRRRKITAVQFNRQIFLSFSSSLVSRQTDQSLAVAGAKFGFNIASEFFFLKNFLSLNAFTLELDAQYLQDQIVIATQNASLNEYSIGGFVNWYPFSNPTLLSENIVFLSLGSRVGFASVKLAGIKESGNYQSLVFPSLRAGFKYNFSNSYGLRLYGQLESAKIGRTSAAGIYADNVSYTDARLMVSLSKFY